MKKKAVALICVCVIILSFVPNVFAESISMTEFESRVNSLTGYSNVSQIYNGYYSGSACYKDLCGWSSWECMAWACKVYDTVWKQCIHTNSTQHSNASNLCVGDYVRYRAGSSWDHSVFITKISGDTVWYTDGNGTNTYNAIRFNVQTTKSNLQTLINKTLLTGGTGFIIHHNSNNLGSGDTAPPVISNARITGKDENGYTIDCTVTDNIGVTSVKCATWTEKNGQDDMVWRDFSNIGGNNYQIWIRFSEYNNVKNETYVNHIYAYDAAGNHYGIAIHLDDWQAPVISNIKIIDKTADGYTVQCTATDSGTISKVQFPTWTLDSYTQNNLLPDWHTNPAASGAINGNTVTYRVNISDYDYKGGMYVTHIYAWDICGNQVSKGASTVIMKKQSEPEIIKHYNGSRYEVYEFFDNMAWNNAKDFCKKLGGELVKIDNAEENNFIKELIANSNKDYYWLGGSDSAIEGQWKWTDGTLAEYNNWGVGEPNNSDDEDCMTIGKNGLWNDVNRNSDLSIGIICEYKDNYYANSRFEILTCYGQKTWVEAQKICEDMGGRLAIIDSAEKNNFIKSLFSDDSKEYYWVDGSDSAVEGQWHWADGALVEYNNWAVNEPNNSNDEDYIAIGKNGLWNDLANTNRALAI